MTNDKSVFQLEGGTFPIGSENVSRLARKTFPDWLGKRFPIGSENVSKLVPELGPTEWSSVWQKEDISRWDYLSQVVFNEVKAVVKDFKSKRIAELGSGSGRISMAMSREGADATLLDMTDDVLHRSKGEFSNSNIHGNFLVGAFPHIPIRDGKFDVVWNSGVMEHFTDEDLARSILEMARVCRKSGIIVTINPYAGSILHTVGTRFMRRASRYPYLDERPLKTLEPILSSLGLDMVGREYSSGFLLLFVGMFKRLSLFPSIKGVSLKVFWLLSDMMCALDGSRAGPAIRFVDRLLADLFGGYLLISVFSPKRIGG